MKSLKSFYNEIDFFFRKQIKFSRKFSGKNELKNNLFDNLPPQKRRIAEDKEGLYLKKYRLDYLKQNSARRNYLENLAIIELLENYIQVDKDSPKILDIGSKNWFYASGQYHFFRYNNFKKEIRLDGIEIDAYRVYSDFCTRRDYALYYTKTLKNCRYITGDLLKHSGEYDYIIWFFPFVTQYPLLEWGLPLSVFKPREMLRHAAGMLNPGGKMLIVNQDENEYSAQQGLLEQLHLDYTRHNSFKNSFLEYEHGRYVTVVRS